jgi:hypothetical protein
MFVPGKPFQLSLMFVGKAAGYLREAPDSFVNYVRKKLYRIGPWGMYYKHYGFLIYGKGTYFVVG